MTALHGGDMAERRIPGNPARRRPIVLSRLAQPG
jgi:hypothetical protein